MLRKKNKPAEAVQDTILSDRLSFLDVIVDTCRNSGRYTVVAESGDQTYTVLIDRGGPFNVDGSDSTGSAALVKAASLRHGTYNVIQGWPVDQPVYQLGLATVLQGLLLGTRPEEAQLPPARGVDAMRNATSPKAVNGLPENDGKGPDPFAKTDTNRVDPFGRSARNGGGLHPFAQAAGPWRVAQSQAPLEPATPFESAAPRKPGPEAIRGQVQATAPAGNLPEVPGLTPTPAGELTVAETVEAPMVALAAPIETIEEPTEVAEAHVEAIDARSVAVEAPVAAVRRAPERAVTMDIAETTSPVDSAKPAATARSLREAARASKVAPNDEAPAAPNQQGWMERRVLKFLLWTIELEDEPDHYTLGQVLKLVGRSLGSALALTVNPITRSFTRQLHRTREDWRRSGEVASGGKDRRTKPATKPGKLRR